MENNNIEKEKLHVGPEDLANLEKEKQNQETSKTGRFMFFKTPYDPKLYKLSFWVSGGLFAAALTLFIILGATLHNWKYTWPIFLYIPVVSSVFACIGKKKANYFAITFLVTALYCTLGMNLSHFWHPGWVMFFAIPLYHVPAFFIDKHFAKKRLQSMIDQIKQEADKQEAK